jgi:hypothetical protein
MISQLTPDVGSIVGCWFPYDGITPPMPGKEFRPCLVLQVIKRIDKKHVQLLMSYGTGQTTDCNIISMNKYSIEVEKGNGNTLSETTKFDLKKLAVLPLEKRFFATPKFPNNSFVRVGQLTTSDEAIVLDKIIASGISMDYSPYPTRTIISKKQITR